MDLDRTPYKFIFYKQKYRNIEVPKRIAEEVPGVGIGHLAESIKYMTTTVTLVYTHP
jgi:hypothetical protein